MPGRAFHSDPLQAAHRLAKLHGMNVVERTAADGGTRFALYRGPVRYRVRLGSCGTAHQLLGLVERLAHAIRQRRRRRPQSIPRSPMRTPR